MDLATKKQLISEMNDVYSKLNDIVIDLHMAVEAAKQEPPPEGSKEIAEEAKLGLIKVKGKRAELGDAIDELIASAMRDWMEQADVISGCIKNATTKLHQIEKNIERRKEIAANVIELVGVVDDLVNLVAKVV